MEKFYLSLFNKYTYTSLVVLLLIISFFAYSAKDFQLDASSDTLILEQDEDLKKYRLVIDDYGSNDFLIVTFTDEKRILTKDNLNQIKLFIDRVSKLNWVESIQSIFDVPLLEVNDQSLTDLINEVLTIESPGVDLNEAEKNTLLKESAEILSMCGNPSKKKNSSTGLVFGYVQSGKTLSMTSVAAMAKDNGFGIVIVLSGAVTPLSFQTAERIAKELKGRRIIKIINNPKKFLSKDALFQNKYRAVSDFISGMTDRYAINLYNNIK